MVSLPASTSLGQIGALQRKLKAYLEAQFESFTGSVAIVPADGFEHAQQQGGDQMSVRVECLYAETGQVEPEARVIRKEHVSAKLAEFLQVL